MRSLFLATHESLDAGATDAAARDAGLATAPLARLSQLLVDHCDAGEIPGAVLLVARDGRLGYARAFGRADVRTGRPMTSDAIFRIASLTKPVTVAAALVLAERGQLALADPVTRYLPALAALRVASTAAPTAGSAESALADCERPLTVHDLMRHTAGFTYGQHGDSPAQRAYRAAGVIDADQTNEQLVEKLARLPLAHQPGAAFEYGMATDVLGRVIEVITGQSLDRALEELVCAPLGLADTAFGPPPRAAQRLAEPIPGAARSAIPVAMYDPARPVRWFSGGGGLTSTARDYARFVQMLLDGGELDGVRVLARKSVELMLANHLPDGIGFAPQTAALGIAAPLPRLGQGYGLGVGVRVAQGPSTVPGSVGDFYWGGATGPYFWADPRERLQVVFMLQELDAGKRGRYRSLLRQMVYAALD